MADTINVRDLPEEDVQFLERWVERLRAKARRERQRAEELEKMEEPVFAVWPLGVKGKLTREDIYDYL
jgi:G:T-mismatch repair DNA endonuclease (very short patch repair protein)